jgi:hypothetical protein
MGYNLLCLSLKSENLSEKFPRDLLVFQMSSESMGGEESCF